MFTPRQQIALQRFLAALAAVFTALFSFNWGDIGELNKAMGEYIGVVVSDRAQTPRGKAVNLTGYETVLFDDFNADVLDTSVWHYRNSGARRAGFNSPKQVSLRDGNLVIKAEYKTDGDYGAGWYSGMISTIQEYKNGYFEIRCICSPCDSFWSAFWLNSKGMLDKQISNGGIGGAEIDIFESFNYSDKQDKDSVSLTVHVDGYQETSSQFLGKYYGKNIYEQYNTYALEWTEDEYTFYINGVECVSTSFLNGVSQAMEYAIVSLEIPDEITKQPGYSTEFIVDYVKIMQKP